MCAVRGFLCARWYSRPAILARSDHLSDETDHTWAGEIIRNRFAEGLQRICDPVFLADRYAAFQRRQDPVYTGLLEGMKDPALAKTFVSYWTIAHTMATQSRFWLENAVTEILVRQVRERQRELWGVYSQAMLSSGMLEGKVSVADLGEDFLEQLPPATAWRVPIQQAALREIDVMVGEQERERRQEDRKPFTPREWDDEKNALAISRDRQHLATVVNALKGPPVQEATLQCNLLVIEPDRLDGAVHAWAFRFVNPKTVASHAARKQERVNMLRLYAYLVQEKILRDPRSLKVGVAALVPRKADSAYQDHYPDYFSTETYWSTERLWKFIGVPFSAATKAIDDVAGEFRQRLKDGLRGLLPEGMA